MKEIMITENEYTEMKNKILNLQNKNKYLAIGLELAMEKLAGLRKSFGIGKPVENEDS